MEGQVGVSFKGKSYVTADSNAYNRPELGAILRNGDEEYIFCHNVGPDIAPSYGAIMSAVTGYSLTLTSISGADQLVGIVKHATVPSGGYGWFLRRGFCQVEMSASDSATTGGILFLGVNGTFALKSMLSAGSTRAGGTIGKAMEGIDSAASGTAYISVY
jgi:hypothetical protein